MHVLLDENLPVDLAPELRGHESATVIGLGWEGVTNGELLRRAAGRFEALLTMDRNLEFQQPLARQPFGVVLVSAASAQAAAAQQKPITLGVARATTHIWMSNVLRSCGLEPRGHISHRLRAVPASRLR